MGYRHSLEASHSCLCSLPNMKNWQVHTQHTHVDGVIVMMTRRGVGLNGLSSRILFVSGIIPTMVLHSDDERRVRCGYHHAFEVAFVSLVFGISSSLCVRH